MPEKRSPLKAFRHLEEKLRTVGLSPEEQARYEELKEIVSPEAPAAPPGRAAAAGPAPAPPRLGQPGLPAADPGPFDLSSLALDDVEAAFDAAMVPVDPEGQGSRAAAPGQDANTSAWSSDQPLDPGAQAYAGGAVPGDAAGANAPGAAEEAAALEAGLGFLGAGSFGVAPAPDAAGARRADAPGYDLGPTAFDAAGLPPEPVQGDRAPWEGAASLPDLPEGGAAREAELAEAELVEAESIEPEPVDRASPGAEPIEPELLDQAPPGARAPDLFAAGLSEPEAGGDQPLDASAFGEPEPAAESPASPELEAGADAAGEDQPAPAGEPFEPDIGDALGSSDAGEPPAFELASEPATPEEPEAAAQAPPAPADAGDFLSHLDLASPPGEPPPASRAGDLEDLVVEEMPPVDVDLGEIAEPTPGPATGGSGLSPTFVPGEHRVLVQTVEGGVLRGTLTDVDLDSPALPLVPSAGAAPEPVAQSRVKAIFFMLLPGGRPPAPEGRKVRVTFRDGKQMAGFSVDDDPGAAGFFIVPAESRTGTGRIWVYRRAVLRVSIT